jgi:hypothetical protein
VCFPTETANRSRARSALAMQLWHTDSDFPNSAEKSGLGIPKCPKCHGEVLHVLRTRCRMMSQLWYITTPHNRRALISRVRCCSGHVTRLTDTAHRLTPAIRGYRSRRRDEDPPPPAPRLRCALNFLCDSPSKVGTPPTFFIDSPSLGTPRRQAFPRVSDRFNPTPSGGFGENL